MIGYKPQTFRGPSIPRSRGTLSQNGNGVTPTQVKSIGTVLGLGAAALGAATAYIGIRAGQRERGFASTLGWIVGIAGGLSALVDTIGVVGLLATPEAQIQASIPQTVTPV